MIAAAVGAQPGTLLTGPAGAGKTLAAAQLAAAAPPGTLTAWCRAGAGYADPAGLLALAAAAAGRPVPAASGEDPALVAAVLLDLLEPGPWLLVLDGYDAADPDSCDPVIAEALPLVDPGNRIVLCSRTRPAGLIGRLPPGLLRVVDADALAFTEDEVAALLAQLGSSRRGAAALHAATAGLACGGRSSGRARRRCARHGAVAPDAPARPAPRRAPRT